MNSITPFITYKEKAEEAVQLYVKLIKNSKINKVFRAPDGSYSQVFFELDGRPFKAMNGGEFFSFTEGFSFFVECENQQEIDEVWNGFLANGGEEGQCGWLTDAYGVSWQIVPRRLLELSMGPDPEKAKRTIAAMLQMKKLVIDELEAAAKGVQV